MLAACLTVLSECEGVPHPETCTTRLQVCALALGKAVVSTVIWMQVKGIISPEGKFLAKMQFEPLVLTAASYFLLHAKQTREYWFPALTLMVFVSI